MIYFFNEENEVFKILRDVFNWGNIIEIVVRFCKIGFFFIVIVLGFVDGVLF